MGYSPWGHQESDMTERLHLKGKDVLTHATVWINLEDIMLSEISQAQKDKYWMILLLRVS